MQSGFPATRRGLCPHALAGSPVHGGKKNHTRFRDQPRAAASKGNNKPRAAFQSVRKPAGNAAANTSPLMPE